MNNTEILRTNTNTLSNYFERQVFGLNIFWTNNVACSVESDPQLEFLRRICYENNVGTNIGNLFDYADSHEELFDKTPYSDRFTTVRIGCYAAEFYDSTDWNSLSPLLFANISSDFIDIVIRDESLIRKILQLDAIAVFVSPVDENSENDLLNLLNSQIVSTEDFIDKATYLYKLVMLSQADGDYFTFFAKNSEDLALINQPLDAALDLIRDSKWYRENFRNLLWDGEYSMCLVKNKSNI